MRCPKCGYNSFEHNLLCPNCRKDLTATRRLLNLTVPAPGAVNFFQTASERSAFPEPLLGAEMTPQGESGPNLSAAAGAFGAAAPFAPPLFSGEAAIEDILPVADDEMAVEDIAPVEDDEELDEIKPVGYDESEDIQPFAAETAVAVSPAAAPWPAGPAALEPAAGEEEIEIEIDDLGEADAFSQIPASDSQRAALDQIKNTLAETGDLAPPAEIELEPPAAETFGVGDESLIPDDLELNGLEEPSFEDIDGSDLLEDDMAEEAGAQASDTIAVDLDPEDLPSDFFDETIIEEPGAALAPEAALPPEEAPDQEDPNLADLAGPFWDDDQPIAEETGAGAPGMGAVDADGGLETEPADFDREAAAEEMFAEEIQAPEMPAEPVTPPEAGAAAKPVHPTAVPEMPAAAVFGSVAPEATLSAPKTTSGSLDSDDDLLSLADDINLDDLDSEL